MIVVIGGTRKEANVTGFFAKVREESKFNMVFCEERG